MSECGVEPSFWANCLTLLEPLVTSRAGSYLVMLAILGLIVLFLRMLFGPHGFFRDPQWDVWNEEARKKSARNASLKSFNKK